MADQAARTLRPEDEISHYRIVGPLGAGGMGEVYLAQDQTLDRSVALKVLPSELTRSEERVRRFVLEAKSASSLSHPNIVTIYEIGNDVVRSAGEPSSGPVHFISMELVSGKTLSTLIHDDKTDLRTLLGFLAQAAEGLAKAHGAGIVHRDLKPGNIMVSADGFAKVLDFGLAKLSERRDPGPEVSSAQTVLADATEEGAVLGTAGYMAPEQVQGRAVDHRADIFSFGCILYEAATRRKPFVAETSVETMHKILHERPTPVEEINAKVPAELRRLIRRCLAKSAEQRLQSMKDLAIELREIVDEYDSLSPSASSGSLAPGGAAPVPARRRPVALWAGIGAAVVALAVVAWWGMQGRGHQGQPYQTMRASVQTSRGDVTDVALSPDGRYLAYVAGRAGRMTLRVRQVATGSDVEILPVTDQTIRNPSFSPDGNYLFYTAVTAARTNYLALYQVPSLGGTPRERAFDVDSRVSFSPDGKQLVFWRRVLQDATSKLVALDMGSERERIVATVPDQEIFQGAPAWSPDGKRIAAALLRPAPDLSTTIAMFDPATGKRQDFTKMSKMILESIAWLRDGTGIVSGGQDLNAVITNQVFLHPYPDARMSRITNDFNGYAKLTTSLADDAIAAVRATRVANLWIADAAGTPARRLTATANPENSSFGAVGLDSATVLFVSVQDGDLQLFTIPVSGGEVRALTSGESQTFNVLAANRVVTFDRQDSSGVHIWRMDADGRSPRRLTSGAGEQQAGLSPDGRYLIATHYDAPRKLSVLSTDDGRVVRENTGYMGTPGFSPDSRSVMIATATQDEGGLTFATYSVYPLDGGPATASFRLPEQAMAPIAWAPDGRSVTFRLRSDPSWNVYRKPFDGGSPVQVTRVTEGRVTAYDWSPDGRRLAIRVEDGETADLWIVESDGSRPVKVTQFTYERVFGFGWMPDSRRLVVTAGTNTSDVVLIREFR